MHAQDFLDGGEHRCAVLAQSGLHVTVFSQPLREDAHGCSDGADFPYRPVAQDAGDVGRAHARAVDRFMHQRGGQVAWCSGTRLLASL